MIWDAIVLIMTSLQCPILAVLCVSVNPHMIWNENKDKEYIWDCCYAIVTCRIPWTLCKVNASDCPFQTSPPICHFKSLEMYAEISRCFLCTRRHDDVIKRKQIPRYWPFVRESNGHRWILLTKASDAALWYFLWVAPEQMVGQAIGTPVISDTITLIMKSV